MIANNPIVVIRRRQSDQPNFTFISIIPIIQIKIGIINWQGWNKTTRTLGLPLVLIDNGFEWKFRVKNIGRGSSYLDGTHSRERSTKSFIYCIKTLFDWNTIKSASIVWRWNGFQNWPNENWNYLYLHQKKVVKHRS